MPSTDPPLPLVVIVGATAVGKTGLAVEVAERLNAEIVSADSRLFYRGMDIGTAKPTVEERRRVPHHLIDVSRPDETWSLARFQQQAARTIVEISERGRPPFLVGGTGQYIRAVIEGWRPPEQEPDPRLRAYLETLAGQIGPFELHRRLGILDAASAASIDPTNLRRTVRALEVILTTGRRFSDQRLKEGSPYRLLVVGLRRPRPELYARIDGRIDAMVQAGFLQEVQSLLAQGYSPQLPSLSAIGYREMVACLQGEMSLDEAVTQMKRLTRRYVRQQSNWFRDEDERIHWFDMAEGTGDAVARLIASCFGLTLL